jgi:hypothetical protein
MAAQFPAYCLTDVDAEFECGDIDVIGDNTDAKLALLVSRVGQR